MIYTLSLTESFSASHILPSHAVCSKMHGHTYRVQITVIGDPEPDTFNMVANDQELRLAVKALIFEIDNRHLNDQLPAVIPSVQGIANWFWERLALQFQLYEVAVWQGDLMAAVHAT